jgi:hypothetical protein
MLQERRTIIESTIDTAYACMQESQQQHIEATTIARYTVYSRAGLVLDGVSAHVPP